jgi:hypothetical protein
MVKWKEWKGQIKGEWAQQDIRRLDVVKNKCKGISSSHVTVKRTIKETR